MEKTCEKCENYKPSDSYEKWKEQIYEKGIVEVNEVFYLKLKKEVCKLKSDISCVNAIVLPVELAVISIMFSRFNEWWEILIIALIPVIMFTFIFSKDYHRLEKLEIVKEEYLRKANSGAVDSVSESNCATCEVDKKKEKSSKKGKKSKKNSR